MKKGNLKTSETAEFRFIGKPMPRKEDERLITGKGRFSDDFAFEGQTYAAMVRSPYPHARIVNIDLGRRGVRCTLLEQKAAPEFLPKMERCNARTMEIFRRMGLADRIRAAA